jgi:hypothetical protein
MEIWPGLLALFERHLTPFSPAPNTSQDKHECIAVQHLIYVLFLLFESIQEGETKVATKEDGNNELIYEGESYDIAPTRNFLLYVNDLFGIKNISVPKLAEEEIALIVTSITQVGPDTPLNEMELHIEQWISDHIDDEWNVYIELAENGDLSVETISHMQRIQKRLAVLGQKTFRKPHVVSSQPVEGAEPSLAKDGEQPPQQSQQYPRRRIYLQKHTRKVKRAISD